MPQQKNYKKYEEEPVTYCARCYSLKIKYEESIGMDCCSDCGCTDFKTSSFEEWEKLFEERYGHRFVESTKDIRKSPIFQLTYSQLKNKVIQSPSWRKICKSLYPAFPRGFSKADSIILLFEKLCQDNRLDDLRIELMNQN